MKNEAIGLSNEPVMNLQIEIITKFKSMTSERDSFFTLWVGENKELRTVYSHD